MNQEQLDIKILEARRNQQTYRLRYEEKGDDKAFTGFKRWTDILTHLYNLQGQGMKQC